MDILWIDPNIDMNYGGKINGAWHIMNIQRDGEIYQFVIVNRLIQENKSGQ